MDQIVGPRAARGSGRKPRPPLALLAQMAHTIRGRIFIAFLAMSVITGALGGYAALGIRRAGVLVTKTFDESLMSINYARAASADFAAMQVAFARRWSAAHADTRAKLDKSIADLEENLAEDLEIAAERSQSARAARAAAKVQAAADTWSKARRNLPETMSLNAAWEALDPYAETVSQQIDLLINYTAGDGFTYRQSARQQVAIDTNLDLIGTAGALLLSGLVVLLLSRRITKPVAAASAVAKRIASGQLDGAIPVGGADELGALLIAMGTMRDNIRAMMEREVAQRRSAQVRLADALESSREGVVVVDPDRRIVLANSQAHEFFGHAMTLLEPGKSADAAAQVDHLASASLSFEGLSPIAGEIKLVDNRWLRVSRSPTRDGGFIAVYSDITVLKDQEAKLKATNLLLDAALDNMSQGLCLYDSEHRLKVVNRRFCEIFHMPASELRPGIVFRDVLGLSIAAGNHPDMTLDQLYAREYPIANQRVATTRFLELDANRVILISRQPMADGGWVATYEDVTERRRAEERIVFMARHDALTGLPNRVLFAERIETAINQIHRGSPGFAVLSLDLDHFKQVNDTLGHPVGDELLRSVAERLQACVREVDTVSRLGGDEFAILQVGLDRPDDAAKLARRVVEILSVPYDIDGNRLTISVSVGIAVAPSDGTAYDKLLKSADVALYLAKADGRATWRFFEPEMDVRLQVRRALELDLRDALENNQFEVHYQPIFDLHENRIGGFEALLRWNHPTRGQVSPAEFISLAEEIGIIVPLGEWVLRTACAEAATWPKHVKLAVNVSVAQFKNEELVQTVTDTVRAAALSSRRLELEITESLLLTNNSATLAKLHELRDLGVRIAMDDFGTGYSSLSYLHSFPFDKIKIDQSFIRGMTAKGGTRAIVRAMTAMGNSLSIRTTAEGVETEEQLAWLRAAGCDEAQGFYFSRAVPANKIPRLLMEWNGVKREAV
jgi:diguanylate cyclase (GGDEF)-like protein/PAS domain S-box-containing protein